MWCDLILHLLRHMDRMIYIERLRLVHLLRIPGVPGNTLSSSSRYKSWFSSPCHFAFALPALPLVRLHTRTDFIISLFLLKKRLFDYFSLTVFHPCDRKYTSKKYASREVFRSTRATEDGGNLENPRFRRGADGARRLRPLNLSGKRTRFPLVQGFSSELRDFFRRGVFC